MFIQVNKVFTLFKKKKSHKQPKFLICSIQFIICCIISYRVESLNLKQRQKSKAAEINMRDLWLLLHTFIHIPREQVEDFQRKFGTPTHISTTNYKSIRMD